MRVVCLSLLALAAGCSTMTVRTGLVLIGGQPAFQASIEAGASTRGVQRGLSATNEYGVESGAHTGAFIATNLDVSQHDPEAGPVGRIGARFRAGFSEPDGGSSAAFELRGAAFTGLGRDAKTRSGGYGVELAGGIAVDRREPIFEANLILHRRWNLFDN